jgi:hypothetical protein
MRISFLAAVAIAAGAAMSAPASAATITMQARYFDGNATFTDSASYVNEWNAVLAGQPTAPTGYGDQTIADWNGSQNNSSVFGANTNIAYHDHVVFDVGSGQAGQWSFRMGIDFGYGGTLLVDGQALDTKTQDLWWSYDITNPNQTLLGSLNLSAGQHVIDVYGFEGCCDGGTEGQFLAPGGREFTNFSGVPEPSTWALGILGIGLTGAVFRRRAALRGARAVI